jgi:ribonuclease HII
MTAIFDPGLIPTAPNLEFENNLWENSFLNVAGLDEAGRGAWAGPVTAAAVVLSSCKTVPKTFIGIRDSKQLSPIERNRLAPIIKEIAAAWGVGFASNQEIDSIGILPATRLAMMRALQVLKLKVDYLLIDALFLPDLATTQMSLIKGDQRSLSIAAASILAKTARDKFMSELEGEIPGYGFFRHKGYGTKIHREALESLGPCLQHRRSFYPVKLLQLSQQVDGGLQNPI